MSGWPKVFRDPVHDVIQLEDNDIDRLIFKLINTREMQRLRRIRQLGFSSLTYPGANHTRLAHSIGVMEISRQMLAVLDRKHPGKIARDEQLRISVMALLHDVGHGPFSHAFEKVTDTDHEDWTRHIILDDTTEVNAVLRAHDAALPAVIAILFDKTSGADAFQGSMRALVDIVSSQLDADRMDYLLRDSMMTGSRLGQIDMSWLVRCVDIDFEKQTLFLSHKGLQAAESNILARHHMFKSVYFHKTTRSAEVMLKSVLEAITLKLRNGADWQTLIPGTGPHLLPAMLGRLDMQSYLRMDDVSVWELLKCCGDSPDPTISYLGNGLVNRRLLKSIAFELKAQKQIATFYNGASDILRKHGFDPDYFLREDKPGDVPFKVYDRLSNPNARTLYVKVDGRLQPLQSVSDPVDALRPYEETRLYVPLECREEIDTMHKRLYS